MVSRQLPVRPCGKDIPDYSAGNGGKLAGPFTIGQFKNHFTMTVVYKRRYTSLKYKVIVVQ